MKMNASQFARFMQKVEVRPSGCWEWTASRHPRGYGQFMIKKPSDGRAPVRKAHRLSYEYWIGPIPDGLQIDHLCRNRACVNPAHLEVVTSRENSVRGKALITHCPAGHEYDEANTYISLTGGRLCRACRRIRERERRRRKRMERVAA